MTTLHTRLEAIKSLCDQHEACAKAFQALPLTAVHVPIRSLVAALGVAIDELYSTSRENGTPYGTSASTALARISEIMKESE